LEDDSVLFQDDRVLLEDDSVLFQDDRVLLEDDFVEEASSVILVG